MITVYHYMTVAAILFAMGTYGVLTRRNAIVIFMCIELMLNSVNLTFIALSSHLQNMDGQVFVLFVMAVAAAEAGVGLALMITFYRNRDSIDVDDINLMKDRMEDLLEFVEDNLHLKSEILNIGDGLLIIEVI